MTSQFIAMHSNEYFRCAHVFGAGDFCETSQNVEIVSNLGPNFFWLKVRTHRLSTLTFVRTFSQFTTSTQA